MGVGNIFVATTLAPLVVVLASVSLQLLTIGLELVRKLASHSNSKVPLYGVAKGAHFLLNTRCFGDMEIDVKSFHNVLLMAILMGLIGLALSMGSMEDAALAKTAGKAKTIKNGASTTPSKKKTK